MCALIKKQLFVHINFENENRNIYPEVYMSNKMNMHVLDQTKFTSIKYEHVKTILLIFCIYIMNNCSSILPVYLGGKIDEYRFEL